jgi:gliding motility-associated-like protein
LNSLVLWLDKRKLITILNYLKKSFTYLLFFLYSLSFSAQENLVPNSSFEEYLTCPNIETPYHFIDRATHWYMPTKGTSDYFNSCSVDLTPNGELAFSVPQNYAGYQQARTGFAYAGYYSNASKEEENYAYEYISVKLIKPLEKGKLYILSYFVSLAEYTFDSAYPLQYQNHSAAHFSIDSLAFNTNNILQQIPQVVSDKNIFLADSVGWQNVQGYYIADGDEQYITIGCFAKFSELEFNYVDEITGMNVIAYYFVDDVSLIETDLVIPNVFTPNQDDVNDFFEIPLSNFDYKVLNRWGNLVFDSKIMNTKIWDGTYNGRECKEGVYFYIIEELKVKGFVQLVR